ncbi:Uncharacterised protein [Burkholderia pseudomallei]|nr:Uncharacterised protein [Burkholderia pseudomallei]
MSPAAPVLKSFHTPRFAPTVQTDRLLPASPSTLPTFHSRPCLLPFGSKCSAIAAAFSPI